MVLETILGGSNALFGLFNGVHLRKHNTGSSIKSICNILVVMAR
jgi:hypothetical protein